MSVTPEELPLPGSFSPRRSCGEGSRFCNRRGVRWRINLGILPSSQSASVEDMRRVAADSRRSYASLRRRLLVDPHTMKDGNRSPDLAMDNPLSQNPESTWGRFFHHAEIEKMVDQDLSRLYPEDGSYFQTSACQGMLRRILLLWCLMHPECGYGQGMHELLAPLVFVLHADLDYLSNVRGIYKDYFHDEFDGLSYPDIELVSRYKIKKAKSWDLGDNGDLCQGNDSKITCLDDLDQDTRDLYLLNDAYGAEGELGVVISERFTEHDAYNMFDALMSGAHGVVAMSDFFSASPSFISGASIPPIIEASSALYHLLSIVDSSLHSHLVELGVEPQYFALRWLRVLFEREFSLNDLLTIWDELFSSSNDSCMENEEYRFRVLRAPRGAFISCMAVSMLLHVRSSLLATENATSCLQRLLNFPRNINVMKLIEKARSYQVLSLEANISSSTESCAKNRSSTPSRDGSASPKTPLRIVPDSYWEQKWRVLHEEETLQKSDFSKGRKIKDLLGKKLGLSRTESDPSPAKNTNRKQQPGYSVRRRLLDEFSQKYVSQGDPVHEILPGHGSPSNEDMSKCFIEELGDQNIMRISEEPCEQITAEEICVRTEISSVSSMATPPNGEVNDVFIESERSSLTSNSIIGENEDENHLVEDECKSEFNKLVPGEVDANSTAVKSESSEDAEVLGVPEVKERKSFSSKFQWVWKFGKGNSLEGGLEGGANALSQRSSTFGNGNVFRESLGGLTSDQNSSKDTAKIEVGDTKMIGTLKNLGQSMLENIQAIESVFQQERGQAGNVLGVKGQAKAIAALKELRKVSNLLSEM
ncbi:hypothetical protein KSP39_PZI001699 [Platanthera zijinensis]|uniref:Rab-GAP TBC domain-containing protein n=1 Tax=Platanthera zijinensis TaxID=2320716 RepID=A0AAP0C0V7_9ASPA